MPSKLDIWNLALSEIGTRSTVADENEASKEATACRIWYDPLREMLLRAAPWGFARGQAVLSELGNAVAGTSTYPWAYKYLYPADMLRMRYLLPPTPTDQAVVGLDSLCIGPSRNWRFLVANDLDQYNQQRRVILSNLQLAQAVYIRDVTDVGLFDPSFKMALAAAMAYKLVVPLTGNAGMKSTFQAGAQDLITSARAADGNEAISTTDHTPDWIAARGSPDFFNLPVFDLGNWYWGWDDFGWGS